MSNERILKIAFNVDGVRLIGRHRVVWLDMVESSFKERKIRNLTLRRSCVNSLS